MSSEPETRKAGPWIRLGARIIDGLVLIIPTLIITVPISGGFRYGSMDTGGAELLASILGALLQFGYFVILETQRGKTIGKSACGLEVRAADGLPTIEQSAKRNAFTLLSVIPGVGGLLSLAAAIAIGVTISRDPRGQGVHDRYAEVLVERD